MSASAFDVGAKDQHIDEVGPNTSLVSNLSPSVDSPRMSSAPEYLSSPSVAADNDQSTSDTNAIEHTLDRTHTTTPITTPITASQHACGHSNITSTILPANIPSPIPTKRVSLSRKRKLRTTDRLSEDIPPLTLDHAHAKANDRQNHITGLLLCDLPDDALRLILGQCSGRSLFTLERVCRRLHAMVHDDQRLWHGVCARELPARSLGLSVDQLLWTPGEDAPNTPREGAIVVHQSAAPAKPTVGWRHAFLTYSNILSNDLISCTGLTPEKKNIQRDLILGMGGQYQGHLDRKVTVLVVALAGTDKHKFAQLEGIPMVTEKWVRDCWRYRRRLPTEQYAPPLFIGLKFCATQVQAGVRNFIEEEAVRRGGEYTADLRKDHNTHLIAVRAEGRKFEFAHRWRMKVVRPKWFFDCIERNVLVDEAEFVINPPTSNPNHGPHNQHPPQQQTDNNALAISQFLL